LKSANYIIALSELSAGKHQLCYFLKGLVATAAEISRIVSWMTDRLATHGVKKSSESSRVILNVPRAVELATQPRHEITLDTSCDSPARRGIRRAVFC